MREKQFAATGHILLATFVGFLGWYFWTSNTGRHARLQVHENMLTAHDDLYSIDGRHDGASVAVGNFGLILLTTDGGKSWSQQTSGTSGALTAISFSDPQHGWIVGSGGTILMTSDAGTSWKAQTSGTREYLLGVYASTATRAYAVGAFGTFLSTSDGGGTWSKETFRWDKLIPRVIQENGDLDPNLNAVYFVSETVGWIVGEFGLILQTRDGGRTWVTQDYGPNQPQLFGVTLHDANRGLAVGQQGTVLKTADGGKHWIRLETGTTKNFYGASMDNERGVIVGDGIALASQDGGSSWKLLESIPQNRWLGGVAMKNRHAIAVGQEGTVQTLDLDMPASEKKGGGA